MSTEGNDLKRRGLRIFSALRRHEEERATAEPAVEEANPSATLPDDPDVGPETTTATPETEPVTTIAPPPVVATPAARPIPDPPASVPESQPAPDPEPTAVAVADPEASEEPEAPAAQEPDEPSPLTPAEGGHVEPATLAAAPVAPTRARPSGGALPGSEDRLHAVDEASAGPGDEPGGDAEPEPYDLPRVIAIANQKGGVGKTTTSVNLGASLAELDFRVLVVDLDPQGNATTGLGINARNLQSSVYDVIMANAAIEDCVEPTSLRNLFVAPATIDLAGAEIELVPAFSRELKLRRALEDVRDEYDYVLIDCPPSLGLLTVNGLAAADDVIVPIQCEYYALEGLSQLIRNVTLVRTNLNPKLDVRGIVLTMYDARTKLADQVEQEVRDHFGRRVYQTVVPRTVRLSEAPSFGQPIIVFDSTSRGAVAYRELAKEVSSGATRRAG
jgi:chromosome partitioning protein